MGQKVNPNGIRLGINKTWSSRWYSKTDYAKLLHQDLKIKQYVEKKLKNDSLLYQKPEYRSFSFISIKPDDLIDKIIVRVKYLNENFILSSLVKNLSVIKNKIIKVILDAPLLFWA